MLTQDENIVDIRFTVQYRLKRRARLPVREHATPRRPWCRPPRSAVREIVGKSTMDSVLYEQRDAIAAELREVDAGAARPLQGRHRGRQRQRAERAGRPSRCRRRSTTRSRPAQDRERFKNEGQAYANDVIPKAQRHGGAPARGGRGLQGARRRAGRGRCAALPLGADRVPEGAAVTRDRLYLDTMQQIYPTSAR